MNSQKPNVHELDLRPRISVIGIGGLAEMLLAT